MIDYLINNLDKIIGGGLIGFIVGILTGLFGAGGGFIITPALNIFIGLPMNFAVGTSSCQVMGASAFSIYHHKGDRKKGLFEAIITGLGIPLGSYLGTILVKQFKNYDMIKIAGRELEPVNFILLGIFAVFLLIIAAWLLYDNLIHSKNKSADDSDHVGLLFRFKIPPMRKFDTIPAGEFSTVMLVILGLFTGFLSGLLGIGGGVIMLPMLFYLVGQETKFATQTSTYLILLSGTFASVFHAIDHNIDYALAIILIFGAFFGAKIGAIINHKISAKSIRQYFGFVVLAAWGMVIFKLYKMIYG